jgi:hypothetical protein
MRRVAQANEPVASSRSWLTGIDERIRLSPDAHCLGLLERAARAPPWRRFFQALRNLVSAAPHRADPKSYLAVRHVVLDVEPVKIVLLAEANRFLSVKGFLCGRVAFFGETIVALLQRIRHGTSRPIAAIGVHGRAETHPKMVDRTMNGDGRRIKPLARQHGRPQGTSISRHARNNLTTMLCCSCE